MIDDEQAPPKNTSLTGQIGGSHYRIMGMQPFEFSLANGWDSAAHTILKYVARHDSKGGEEDVRKSLHVCEIRRDIYPRGFDPESGVQLCNSRAVVPLSLIGQPPIMRVPVGAFIASNKLRAVEAAALHHLEDWVLAGHRADHALHCKTVQEAILAVLHARY